MQDNETKIRGRPQKDAVEAVVQKIVPDGKHGPYFVATSPKIKDGSVTCSLDSSVWKEKKWPEEGSIVVISDVIMKREGWRANFARFKRLADRQDP